MSAIYQVTVSGRRLESRDLRKLLARAVAEKRNMDQRLRFFASLPRGVLSNSQMSISGSLCAENSSSR
jgi:hypothetical protein